MASAGMFAAKGMYFFLFTLYATPYTLNTLE